MFELLIGCSGGFYNADTDIDISKKLLDVVSKLYQYLYFVTWYKLYFNELKDTV